MFINLKKKELNKVIAFVYIMAPTAGPTAALYAAKLVNSEHFWIWLRQFIDIICVCIYAKLINLILNYQN